MAVLATYLSRRAGIMVELPINLVGLTVVFPLVFSINSAYKMREDALKSFAGIKAHAVALYFAHRDWPPEKSIRQEHTAAAKERLQQLVVAIYEHFRTNDGGHGASFHEVYAIFSVFSKSHEELRAIGVPANEISRANQIPAGNDPGLRTDE
ncbi:MAG: hypothetical protein GY796_33065 [Chloroflexi bacterium]|nr:hypothetical protein [Chloroflexota bacterium]